ncbi:MAG: hypothetical protein ACYCVB_18920 [Bacilli bacterium]
MMSGDDTEHAGHTKFTDNAESETAELTEVVKHAGHTELTDDAETDRLISSRLKDELAGLRVREEWVSAVARQMVGVDRVSGADAPPAPASQAALWLRRCQTMLNAELEIPLPAIMTAGVAVVVAALIVATSWQITVPRPAVYMWRVSESHHGAAVIVQEEAVKL